MRVAILGFGKVAESTHLPGIALARRPFEIVAVAEPSPERRARARASLPAAPGRTWREDPRLALGGVLVDHGWHAFTVLHALLGSGPRRVRATVREEPGKPDVFARVRLEQAGARVLVRLTWRATRRANRA